jgi:hypothetical protein
MSKVIHVRTEHLVLLREAVVLWDPIENGAPFIIGYGSSETNPVDGFDKILEPYLPQDMKKNQFKATVRNEMKCIILLAMHQGKIQPGTYRYINPLRRLEQNGFTFNANEITEENYRIRNSSEIEFNLSKNHIDLIRHANIGWQNYIDSFGINAKRPYGEFSYMQDDMKRILHIDESIDDDLHNHLEYLHQETLIAFQVMLLYAYLEPGQYAIDFEC